ncbi:hypothetical protein EGW08_011113 [Elysia chlorotica]|uniref:Uncharacterized protein n=1 Tax=Elysia chlorotica TaxID=188477 RepID=A0A433THN7_ELYCH|nr:hypothetical protein EGW08_011113 [Elysia chlorotica]
MSSPAQLSGGYQGLNTSALGPTQNFHIWDTVLPFDEKDWSKLAVCPSKKEKVAVYKRCERRVLLGFSRRAWSDQLEQFYYNYNNRISKATQPSTLYEKFFGRPNFSTTTAEIEAPANLTSGEREFLRDCHLNVEADDGNNPEDELPDPSTPTAVSSAPVLEDDVEESEPTMDQLPGPSVPYQAAQGSWQDASDNRRIYIASFNKQYPLERFSNSAAETVGITLNRQLDRRLISDPTRP